MELLSVSIMDVDDHLSAGVISLLLIYHIFTDGMDIDKPFTHKTLCLCKVLKSHFLIRKKLQFIFL